VSGHTLNRTAIYRSIGRVEFIGLSVTLTYQDLVRDDLPVAVTMAGLTHGINTLLDLPGATFLRRARHYELGPLTLEDARTALSDTARDGRRRTHGSVQQGLPLPRSVAGVPILGSCRRSRHGPHQCPLGVGRNFARPRTAGGSHAPASFAGGTRPTVCGRYPPDRWNTFRQWRLSRPTPARATSQRLRSRSTSAVPRRRSPIFGPASSSAI